jgi:hypothetical protein
LLDRLSGCLFGAGGQREHGHQAKDDECDYSS